LNSIMACERPIASILACASTRDLRPNISSLRNWWLVCSAWACKRLQHSWSR